MNPSEDFELIMKAIQRDKRLLANNNLDPVLRLVVKNRLDRVTGKMRQLHDLHRQHKDAILAIRNAVNDSTVEDHLPDHFDATLARELPLRQRAEEIKTELNKISAQVVEIIGHVPDKSNATSQNIIDKAIVSVLSNNERCFAVIKKKG